MTFSIFFILVSLLFAGCMEGTPYSDKYYSSLALSQNPSTTQGASRENSDDNETIQEGSEEVASEEANKTKPDAQEEEEEIIKEEIISSLTITPKEGSIVLDEKQVVKTLDKYTYVVDQYAITEEEEEIAEKPLFYGNHFLGIIEKVVTQDGETTLSVTKARELKDVYVAVEASFEKEEIISSLTRSLQDNFIGTYDQYNTKPLRVSVVTNNSLTRSTTKDELVLRVELPQGYRIPLDRSIEYDVTSTNRQEIDLGVNNSTNEYLVVDSQSSYIEFSVDMQTSIDFTAGSKELVFVMRDKGYFISNLEVTLQGEFTQNFDYALNLFKPIEILLSNSKTSSITTKIIFTPDIAIHIDGEFTGEVSLTSQTKMRNDIEARYEDNNITATNDEALSKSKPEFKVDFAAQSNIMLFPYISRDVSVLFDKIDETIGIGEIRSGVKYDANFKGEVDNSLIANPSEYNNKLDTIEIDLMAYSYIDSRLDVYSEGKSLYKDIGYNELYKGESVAIIDLQISINGLVDLIKDEVIEDVVTISNILASDITQTSMTLVWASSISGELSIDSYGISYLDKSEDSKEIWSEELLAGVNLHRALKLNHSTPYQFRIRAKYSDETYSDYEYSETFTTVEGEIVVVAERTIRDYDERILAHERSIQSLALSRDNTMILSAGSDGLVKLTDRATGNELKEFDARSGDIMSAVINKNNDMVIAAGKDGEIRIWDVPSEKLVNTLSAHTNTITKLILSNDESFLVSAGNDEQIIIWDLASGTAKKTLTAHTDDILDLSLSSDDKILASGGEDKVVKLWDLEKMKVIKTLVGHTSRVRQVDISRDGKYIVSNDYNDIKLWDLESGILLHTLLYHDDIIRSLMISHDSRRLISGSDDGSIYVYHIDNESLLFELDARNDWIMGLTSTNDDKTIFTGSDLGYIKVWNLP